MKSKALPSIPYEKTNLYSFTCNETRLLTPEQHVCAFTLPQT